jgi:hypothetical protein
MLIINRTPHFSLVSSLLLLIVIVCSRYATTCILCREESDFWYEVLCASTAIAMHIIAERNLHRFERDLLLKSKRKS